MDRTPRRICFVTGTRAEFGLMRSTLRAIQGNRNLQLQLVVTGMHLSKKHGRSIDGILAEGWPIAATVPWVMGDGSPTAQARAMGLATAKLAGILNQLKSDIVLVVGDRVEAFAAATAATVGQRILAHVHGGDRAEGQVDDSLRHAITKLAHVHFAASAQSAKRIERMGEDKWRIHNVGAPGLDGIAKDASSWTTLHAGEPFGDLQKNRFALVLLHPVEPNDSAEEQRADIVLKALNRARVEQAVVIMPNSDPGSVGIQRAWSRNRQMLTHLVSNLSRPTFLGLLRDCAVMVGNSSAGIIEAGAFGTPVVNIGSRQAGRERGRNVVDVGYDVDGIGRAIVRAIKRPRTAGADNTHPYGCGSAGKAIARVLAQLQTGDQKFRRKRIVY